MDRLKLARHADALGVLLDDKAVDAMAAFEEDLYRANEVMNLTRVPREVCWVRHFLDSLLIAPCIPQGARVVDLGCGPGFPSWPLAVARRDLVVVALDSSSKMLGFLQRHPLPNLTLVRVRAESWRPTERFDFVTGRAFAPLPAQLEVGAPLCKLGGQVAPMRAAGETFELESLSALGLELERVEARTLPILDAVRAFPVYLKARETPARFPRSWADITKRPLD